MTDLSTLSDADLQALYAKSAAAKSVSQMSDDELKAAYSKPAPKMSDVAGSARSVAVSPLGDFARSIPGGLVKGLSGAASAGGQAAQIEMGQPVDVPNAAETAKHLEKNVTGDLPKPQGRAGKYGETVGEFLGNPASYVGPGGLPIKLATGVTGALGSEAAGQATEGTKAEPFARVAGAMLGGAAPSVGARIVTPLPASPARQRLVDILNNEGVTSLTAGQRTGNESLRYAESALGNAPFAGGQTNRITRQGQEQFTEAATRRAGTGPDFGPETAANNQQRLGNEFERLANRNPLVMDRQFVADINNATRQYQRVPPSQQKAIVEGYVDDIMTHAQSGGVMPGSFYQEMRSRLSRQANGLRESDPTLSQALRDMRDALDNTWRRSVAPADREAMDTARREYGAQKVLEKAASRAGEATAEGQIVPANLRNTVAAENRGAYARGQGPFSELARAGSAIMAPMPQSGTAPRSMIYHLMNWGSAGALPAAMGRVLMSRPVQGYLGNQVIPGSVDPRRAAIVNALVAAQQQAGE